MNTVIFKTENTIFTFSKKEVKEHLIALESEYDSDEVTQLLKLISTDSDETILNTDDHNYFGYVVLELIGSRKGTATCNICGKIYDADRLKEFALGHGKSPFNINQEQKGGFNLFEKGNNPSRFGGRGLSCPKNHELIAMETWRT